MLKNKIIYYLLVFCLILLNSKTKSDSSCQPCGSSSKDCAGETGSKSFFRPRSVIEDVTFYLGLSNYNNYKKYFSCENTPEAEPSNIHLYRGMYYEQSRNGKDLAKYFLPNNQTSVTIKEDGTGDIGSLWLKLIAPNDDLYDSVLSLCPSRNILGSFVNYRQDFVCINGLWLDIKFAIYFAEHELHPKEVLNSQEGTLNNAATALQSLDSPRDMRYGRISKCKLKAANFDDIEVKTGYTFLGCPESGYHLDFYGSMLIPIAPQPIAEFLFEPLIGRGHFGLGFGLNGGYAIFERENKSLAIMGDFSYQYLFSREEKRSFDLIDNGPWSRYLRLVNRDATAISSPAINFLTKCVNVTPRSTINLWTALHYQHCAWHMELGYNLWWRQSEKICLKKGCPPFGDDDLTNLGIFDLANVCNTISASTANISQSKTLNGVGANDVVGDSQFVALSVADLDLASASHPSVLTNKFYGAVSYDFVFRCRPVNIGLGASIELSRDKNALEQWGIWANMNVNF